MSDSIGGTYIVGIIVLFIIIASGYMAFNANYTKAFRMKDKLITVYERNNGTCDRNCIGEIVEYAESIGYTGVTNLNCPAGYYPGPDGYTAANALYCFKKTTTYEGNIKGATAGIGNDGIVHDRQNVCYYSFVTKINIRIPVVDNVFDLKLFKIMGDTKAMTDCK